MIRTYFRMLIEEELPDAVGKMKQFASWFTHGVPGGAHLRKEIYESKSAPEILCRVEAFFEARLYVNLRIESAPEILCRVEAFFEARLYVRVPECGPDALVREL